MRFASKYSVEFAADPIHEPHRGEGQVWVVTSTTRSGRQKVAGFPDWLRGNAVKYAFHKQTLGHKDIKVTLQKPGEEGGAK